jgi:hypothetical protein
VKIGVEVNATLPSGLAVKTIAVGLVITEFFSIGEFQLKKRQVRPAYSTQLPLA